MKNDNQWVALDNEGTIWVYCVPGQNNVLGLVFKVNCHWEYIVDFQNGVMFNALDAAIMVEDFV